MRFPALRIKAKGPVTIEDVIEQMSGRYSMEDQDLVRRAHMFSARAHHGQLRKSGEPYVVHPLAVAMTLTEQRLDATSIAVGLLHDVLEDTQADPERVQKEFGDEVLSLVEGVTQISKISFTTREQEQAENFRKLLLAMVEDIRVLFVKLADRFHNMRTLTYLSPDAQLHNAHETMEIYAPLAERLGMGRLQVELEDLALEYSEPVVYRELVEQIESQPRVRDAFIARIRARIESELSGQNIEARV